MQKRFYLSETDKKLGGVCGGLAEYFGIDSLIVRIVFVILFFGYGCGLLGLYPAVASRSQTLITQ